MIASPEEKEDTDAQGRGHCAYSAESARSRNKRWRGGKEGPARGRDEPDTVHGEAIRFLVSWLLPTTMIGPVPGHSRASVTLGPTGTTRAVGTR